MHEWLENESTRYLQLLVIITHHQRYQQTEWSLTDYSIAMIWSVWEYAVFWCTRNYTVSLTIPTSRIINTAIRCHLIGMESLRYSGELGKTILHEVWSYILFTNEANILYCMQCNDNVTCIFKYPQTLFNVRTYPK